MSAALVVLGLVALANLAMNVAELMLLRHLEQEFRPDHGHSMRDLADRTETLILDAAIAAVGVAVDLAADRIATEGVATDLAGSHARADAAEGAPGEASDAASRSPQED